MTMHRLLRYAVIISALSFILFILNLLLFGKSLYVLYADLFQSGQMYQGETRAALYNRFLLTVIAPCSFLTGGALTWVLITHRRLAFISATLIFIAVMLATAFLHLEPIAATPQPLSDHPDAKWSGGVDGGSFFEITVSDPPRYFLEIRYENSTLWAQGWVDGQGQTLTSSDLLGYYGGDTVELKNGRQLQLENKDGTPIDID